MEGGHSPFDIDPREKQARMGRSVPYEILIGIVVVLVTGFTFYALYRYERAKVVAGPLVQARPDGSLLVAWRTAGEWQTRLDVNLASSSGDSAARTVTVDPEISEGHFVGPLPAAVQSYPYSSYWIRSSMLLFYRTQGPWSIVQPRANAPFRFVVFGESGGATRPRVMATAILQTQPQLVLHIGDLIQETGEWGTGYDRLYQDQFLGPYSILINTMPVMPVISGQEASIKAGEPFRRFFVLPKNGPPGLVPELNYWFDYGTARFVAIDSNQSVEAMRDQVVPWLRDVMAGAAIDWKFVFLQRTPYTGGSQDPADERVRQVLVPAFEASGVDAVFSAGNHRYERTHPLRAGQVMQAGEGILYVTTGAGGRTMQAMEKPVPAHVAAFDDQAKSFTVIDLAGGRLHLRQVNEYNELIDEWWYTKPAGTTRPATRPAATEPAG